jgi:tungstate transport system ATP-binding protein
MLTVKDLCLTINKRRILAVPEFTVRRGEFTAVIGPNGAGKTSLLRALGAIGEASYQSYSLDGTAHRWPTDRLAITRLYSHVFQAPRLLSGSVLDNVSLPLRLRGMSSRLARERALHWLGVTQAETLATRQAKTLSGGETARVVLAQALVTEPRIVFLDEPFTYLDVEARAYLLRHLREWLALTDTTGVMVSHDYSEVALLADRLVVMDRGMIVADGEPSAILAAPTRPFLCDFVSLGRAAYRTPTPTLPKVGQQPARGV